MTGYLWLSIIARAASPAVGFFDHKLPLLTGVANNESSNVALQIPFDIASETRQSESPATMFVNKVSAHIALDNTPDYRLGAKLCDLAKGLGADLEALENM